MAADTEGNSPSAGDGKKGRFNWLIWPVAIIGLVAAGIYGYQRLKFDDTHIVTDNAQVQGQMIKILASERGYLQTVNIRENEKIAEGDVLAELENRYYKLEVDRAQAKLNSLLAQQGSDDGDKDGDGLSEAKLDTAQANLEVVRAQLSEAQSNASIAKAQVTRLQRDQLNDDASQSDVDSAQVSLDQANARMLTLQKEELAAQQQVQEALANEQLLEYNIEEARAELAQAKLSLEYTQIKAPLSGHATQINVNPGMMVEQGQYMLTVISDDNKWLVANIRETDFERIFIGDNVNINIDAFPGTNFVGVVESLAPAAGNQFSIIPRNNASGNFIKIEALIPVMIRFIEPAEEIEKLIPGMSAEVQIAVDPKRKPRTAADPISAHPAKAAAKTNATSQPAKPAPAAADSSSDQSSAKPAAANGQ